MTGAEHYPETRRRIRLAVAAWAYEVHDDPVMSDAEFDTLARSVDLSIGTDRPDLDEWFRETFDPSTGIWIHAHPEPEGLERIYRMLRTNPSPMPIPIDLRALCLWAVAP